MAKPTSGTERAGIESCRLGKGPVAANRGTPWPRLQERVAGCWSNSKHRDYDVSMKDEHAGARTLPVGFVRTGEDRIEKIADRQVQEAIAGVFTKFHQLGSARQTMLWYREERIPLP